MKRSTEDAGSASQVAAFLLPRELQRFADQSS